MIQAVYDWGGWMWVVIDIVAVAILRPAIAYGSYRWSTRPLDPAVKQASDEATRELYHHHRP
jgi:hypothetical protein